MEIDINNLHHAYLIEGDSEEGYCFIEDLLLKLPFKLKQNPDFHLYKNESFTISDARNLKELAKGKSFEEKKIFIINSKRFNLEAQNSLLKILEEPNKNTHIFIILRESELLIPTLLSRVQVIKLFSEGSKKNDDAKLFLNLSPKERMDFVKKFIDKDKPLSPFLDMVLEYLKKNNESIDEIKKIMNIRKFSDDSTVMSRLILEHLSLALK